MKIKLTESQIKRLLSDKNKSADKNTSQKLPSDQEETPSTSN